MTLPAERYKWREQMENGTFEIPHFLLEYKQNRDSDLWRMSRQHEKLCEYALFLEDKINAK